MDEGPGVSARELIVSAWRDFRAHAGGCIQCGVVEDAISHQLGAADFSKDALRRDFADACSTGEALLWTWDVACQDAQDAGGTVSKRLGVWHEGPMLKARQDALMALPDREFRRVLALEPEERRMAEVDALARAYERTRTVVLPMAPDGNHVCKECGARVKNPAHEVCTSCYRQGKR